MTRALTACGGGGNSGGGTTTTTPSTSPATSYAVTCANGSTALSTVNIYDYSVCPALPTGALAVTCAAPNSARLTGLPAVSSGSFSANLRAVPATGSPVAYTATPATYPATSTSVSGYAPYRPDAVWVRAVSLSRAKKQITLRIDEDVVDFFKQSGSRYQSRINAVLRAYTNSQKQVA